MPMTFEEAEARFRQLQARVQRGEPVSRAEYEEQVSQLGVQDTAGVLWEINPHNGKWMRFDGAEWVSGIPPGHDTSVVIPIIGATTLPSRAATPSVSAPQPSASPESVQPYRRVGRDRQRPGGKPPRGTLGGTLGGTPPAQLPPTPSVFAGREWVPLAIGAVVLVLCAALLYFGGSFALNTFAKPTTPTRIALPTLVSSPVPTIVRLPSLTPLPPIAVPVVGKTIEALVNVRAQPNTRATILTRLKKDTLLTLTAVGPTDAGNVWYQINLTDRPEPGWVRSDTFQLISGDPKTLQPAGGAPTATKPAVPGATPTLTPIGVVPPTPKR